MIPLGILAATGDTLADYELISTVYGNGTSPTITFDNIPTSFKHLRLYANIRGQQAATSVTPTIRFNGVTSGYWWHNMVVSSSAGTAPTSANGNNNNLFAIPGDTSSPNNVAAFVMTIMDYQSVEMFKTAQYFAPQSVNSNMRMASITTTIADPITSIGFNTASGFTTTSRFTLLGIKG